MYDPHMTRHRKHKKHRNDHDHEHAYVAPPFVRISTYSDEQPEEAIVDGYEPFDMKNPFHVVFVHLVHAPGTPQEMPQPEMVSALITHGIDGLERVYRPLTADRIDDNGDIKEWADD